MIISLLRKDKSNLPLLFLRRGMRGGSQINKTFLAKLNLLGNYNFVVGEPLRPYGTPPLLLSQGEEFENIGTTVHIMPPARG